MIIAIYTNITKITINSDCYVSIVKVIIFCVFFSFFSLFFSESLFLTNAGIYLCGFFFLYFYKLLINLIMYSIPLLEISSFDNNISCIAPLIECNFTLLPISLEYFSISLTSKTQSVLSVH